MKKQDAVWSSVQDTAETLGAMLAHPAADLFPMMPSEELDALAEDIRKNGQIAPIVTFNDGKTWWVLDGRNRLEACRRAGVHPTTTEWHGDDPYAFAVSANLARRHLTDSQRAMVATQYAALKKGRPVNAPAGAFTSEAKTQDEAAKLFDVSRRNIQRARRVTDQGSDEVVAAVRSGKVSVNAAERLVTLPKEAQRQVLAEGNKAVLAAAKTAPTTGAKSSDYSDKKTATAFKRIIADVANVAGVWDWVITLGTWDDASASDKRAIITELENCRKVAAKLIRHLED